MYWPGFPVCGVWHRTIRHSAYVPAGLQSIFLADGVVFPCSFCRTPDKAEACICEDDCLQCRLADREFPAIPEHGFTCYRCGNFRICRVDFCKRQDGGDIMEEKLALYGVLAIGIIVFAIVAYSAVFQPYTQENYNKALSAELP